MSDIHTVEMVAEVLASVVSRHASVRDNAGGGWILDGEPLFDERDAVLYVSAGLHPGDARDGARDLLDRLAARGLTITRAVQATGNSLAARLGRLADQIASTTDPARLDVLASILSALAEEAAERDDAVVPAHARVPHSGLPDGVARLSDRRRA